MQRSVIEGSTETEGVIVCQICESQFTEMSRRFDKTFGGYLRACQLGETRDTPAKRVHDLAFDNQENSTTLVAWFLAIAVERLVALETTSIPT